MGYVRSIAAAALLVPIVVAAQVPPSTQGLGLYLGYNSDYRKATLGYETPRLWGHQFQNGWGRVDLSVELGVSYWEAKRGRSESMGQVSAIPMLRWWPTDGFYVELGSGPTVMSRSEFAGRDLGTRFQFGSHLGTGLLIKKVHRIGIRYSHYSNANLKKPNPGLDLLGLTYTYQF
ncbi:MAG: acyloxyacyl hydrolase [Burkholderiaceae bacterium]|nr:acyloxyacyl hydrolase [Burkholderiaceae bacterium]